MLDWRLGTMGFGYADWRGTFYPIRTKSTDFLTHYAKAFNTVELDTTFYATPSVDRVRRWAQIVPDNFLFCTKTPREITHERPLSGSVKPMLHFLDALRHFDRKLGAVLLQFPPSFSSGQFPALATFLRSMPPDIHLAVEFRNDSWQSQRTYDLLRKTGVSLVAADYGTMTDTIVPTADFLYLRWIGIHNQFTAHDHERLDMTDRLVWWKQQILDAATGVRTVFGFFNNDYAGQAIATANRFKDLLGLPRDSAIAAPKQGTLFS